jgi:hypothetical protein
MLMMNSRARTLLLAACAAAVAGILACGGTSFAQSGKLAEELATAQKTHPDILAAEAKVRLAQAELDQARMKVAQEVLSLHWQIQHQELAIRILQVQYHEKKSLTTECELASAESKMEELRSQMDYILGKAGRPGPEVASYTYFRVSAEPKKPELPKGEMADTIRTLLANPAELEFVDTPISEIAAYLSDRYNIRFIVDENGPKFASDMPVTLSLKGVPLGAALQALEDMFPPLRFVIRDYGILVTSKDSQVAKEGISAVEYWKEGRGNTKK